MEDLGYACCESAETLKEILSQFPKLEERDVALILGMMARTHTGCEGVDSFITNFPPAAGEKFETRTKSWNVNIFTEVIKELVSQLKATPMHCSTQNLTGLWL